MTVMRGPQGHKTRPATKNKLTVNKQICCLVAFLLFTRAMVAICMVGCFDGWVCRMSHSPPCTRTWQLSLLCAMIRNCLWRDAKRSCLTAQSTSQPANYPHPTPHVRHRMPSPPPHQARAVAMALHSWVLLSHLLFSPLLLGALAIRMLVGVISTYSPSYTQSPGRRGVREGAGVMGQT